MAMTIMGRGAGENSVKYAIAAPRLRASCSMKPDTVVLMSAQMVWSIVSSTLSACSLELTNNQETPLTRNWFVIGLQLEQQLILDAASIRVPAAAGAWRGSARFR